jgi:hypothetical protein
LLQGNSAAVGFVSQAPKAHQVIEITIALHPDLHNFGWWRPRQSVVVRVECSSRRNHQIAIDYGWVWMSHRQKVSLAITVEIRSNEASILGFIDHGSIVSISDCHDGCEAAIWIGQRQIARTYLIASHHRKPPTVQRPCRRPLQ